MNGAARRASPSKVGAADFIKGIARGRAREVVVATRPGEGQNQ
jgi:hypothetical protein